MVHWAQGTERRCCRHARFPCAVSACAPAYLSPLYPYSNNKYSKQMQLCRAGRGIGLLGEGAIMARECAESTPDLSLLSTASQKHGNRKV